MKQQTQGTASRQSQPTTLLNNQDCGRGMLCVMLTSKDLELVSEVLHGGCNKERHKKVLQTEGYRSLSPCPCLEPPSPKPETHPSSPKAKSSGPDHSPPPELNVELFPKTNQNVPAALKLKNCLANKQSNKNPRCHTKQQLKGKINMASLQVLSEGAL